MFDKEIEREQAKEVVREKGWDAFLSRLQTEFPDRDLYSVSTSWYDNPKYICKAKGARGDVVIGWRGGR